MDTNKNNIANIEPKAPFLFNCQKSLTHIHDKPIELFCFYLIVQICLCLIIWCKCIYYITKCS